MNVPEYITSRRQALKLALSSGLLLPAAAGSAFRTHLSHASAAQPDATPPKHAPHHLREVRGTWVTTTANDAIASPANTARTMRALREIGLNTVYVEVWKNGYTQFPSKVLERTIGVDRRPALIKQDPADDPAALKQPGRDLLAETLHEAHRNGLVYIAWFEYGFMAAHKDTDNHLRRQKPDWLSKDIKGNVVAPNGFVWMNPLHPEARRFLLDLVLEAIDTYDLDGIQIDDRIVWPYITMGYDDYTRAIYAQEHNGAQPPDDHTNEAWRRWRADKVNEFSKLFVQEIRAKRPGLVISLSPAVYPWCYENYCLEWPKWAAWTSEDSITLDPKTLAPSLLNPQSNDPWPGQGVTPRWDDFIPQCYRFSYDAFEKTWLDQVNHMKDLGANRVNDMYAGIRVVGEGKDSTWDDLRKSIELVRSTGGGGHVHWFSRGVLDVFPKELTAFYNAAKVGHATHPRFPDGWRPPAIPLKRENETSAWSLRGVPPGRYRVYAKTNDPASNSTGWTDTGQRVEVSDRNAANIRGVSLPNNPHQVELLIDRTAELSAPRLRT